MGGPDNGPELPRSLFYCRLEDQPDHLIPQRYRAAMGEGSLPDCLVVSPECIFASPGELPCALTDSGLSFTCFSLNAPMVWVPDPASGSLRPFSLSPALNAMVDKLRTGKLAASDLPADRMDALIAAGILTTQEKVARQKQEWEEVYDRARREFSEKLYAPVGGLIHPFHLSAMRRYYRFLIRKGAIALGDDQSPKRFVAHNEGVARFFHQQLTPAVSAIAGEPVKPSYVYLASYQPGAVLEKHTDRAQCEFSITFCLDYSPEPDLATPWPIFLDAKSGRVALYQGIGDALFYRGCQVPHWRHALPQGHTSTSIFFHYVREAFSGKLD